MRILRSERRGYDADALNAAFRSSWVKESVEELLRSIGRGWIEVILDDVGLDECGEKRGRSGFSRCREDTTNKVVLPYGEMRWNMC